LTYVTVLSASQIKCDDLVGTAAVDAMCNIYKYVRKRFLISVLLIQQECMPFLEGNMNFLLQAWDRHWANICLDGIV